MPRFQQSQHALGSEVILTLVGDDEPQIGGLFDTLWREIRLFEATFSRFQPDSELTHVNQQAGLQTEVSIEFLRLIQQVKIMVKRSEGLYNPFILPGLQAAGYKGSWPNPAQHDESMDFSARRTVQPEALVVGPNWIKIPAKSALDFGGIGKGYLLDQLSAQLQLAKLTGYWLSLGGDLICAGKDTDDKLWRIGLQQADALGEAAYIENSDGTALAVATSGITKRRGSGWHHIIDPRTAKPAKTDVLTASVALPDGVEADIFAKCLVIIGSQEATGFASRHKIKDFLLQSGPIENIGLRAAGSIIPV